MGYALECVDKIKILLSKESYFINVNINNVHWINGIVHYFYKNKTSYVNGWSFKDIKICI